jgi:site-specific DNA-methyltransferase (adenine-specific)
MVEKKVVAPYRDENGNPKDWWVNEDGEKVRLTYPGNLWTEFSVPFWSSKEVRSYAKTKRTPNNTLVKHPTQKPKDLVKRCIMASSSENDLVADYFLGSGTTMVVCKEINRECIGFEVDGEYIKIIEKRMSDEVQISPPESDEVSQIDTSFFEYE